jgi:hypothetical protein
LRIISKLILKKNGLTRKKSKPEKKISSAMIPSIFNKKFTAKKSQPKAKPMSIRHQEAGDLQEEDLPGPLQIFPPLMMTIQAQNAGNAPFQEMAFNALRLKSISRAIHVENSWQTEMTQTYINTV